MSFDLSELRFDVNTEKLDDAIKKIAKLATSVKSLNDPLSDLGTEADNSARSVVKGAEAGEQAARKQVKQTDMMGQAVDAFYKQKDKLAKQDLANQERAITTQERQAKTQQDILQRQVSILDNMNDGWSKGQASILAAGKAAGLTNDEMSKLQTTVATIRKLQGQDPFDQSTSGLVSLTKELGQAREGYRQLIDYTKRYEAAKAQGDGSESSIMMLSKKETDNLYRDKLRAFELFKQQRVVLKEDVAARIAASEINIATGNEELHAQKLRFRASLRDTENHYKNIANIKRPLEDIRAVEGTKKRDKLNYLARATSVQLGDIGVSLAGGQNPLTVLLQQGDQMRAIFGDIGREGHNMQTVLNSAFTQIVSGFRDVALNLGKVVLIAVKNTAMGFAEVAMSMTGMKATINEVGIWMDTLAFKMGMSSKASTEFGDKFKAMATSFITPVIAVGVLGLVAILGTLAIAYKNILATSHELSNALITNGAALAVTKKEAMAMSGAMASGAATSLDVAKVITEVAQAGNLGKESLLGITTAALDMNRYLGASTKDVVTQYSKLADDPVKALSEIGMATGRVSAATVNHVRDLIEEGDKVGAVALATSELSRVYTEMARKAIAEMTPLGALWDSMKIQIDTATESVYKFAQSDTVVSTLKATWENLALGILGVVYLIKQAIVLSEAAGKGVQAALSAPFSSGKVEEIMKSTADMKAALKANDTSFIDAGKDILNPSSARDKASAAAQQKTEDIRKTIAAQDGYYTVMEAGMLVQKKAITTEEKYSLAIQKTERDAIKAQLSSEARQKQFGANSKLALEEREKQRKAEVAQNNRDAKLEGLGAGANLADIEKRRANTEHSINEHFKDKKPAGAGAAIKDSYNSRIEIIQNAQAKIERDTKLSVDKINSEHKRGMINDLDYINQVADAETATITKSIDAFKAQQGIASQKKNSLKEVQKIEGDIEKARDSLAKRELDRGFALLELNNKLAKENSERNADLIEGLDKEATALEKQLQDAYERIDTIGLETSAIAAREAAKLSEQATEMRRQAIGAPLEEQTKELLRQATAYDKLSIAKIAAESKTAYTKVAEELKVQDVKFDPSESDKVIGAESKKVAAYNATARAVIDAEILIATARFNAERLNGGVSAKRLEEFDKFTEKTNELKAKLDQNFTVAVRVDGLQQISDTFNGLSTIMSGFSKQANTELETLKATISRTGSQYASMFKDRLKSAEDSANGFKRMTTALGGFSNATKKLAENDKTNAKGSKEHFRGQISGYGDMAGAAASYFDESSDGYKILTAIEQGFRAFEMASSIAAIAQKWVETDSSIAANVAGTGPAVMKGSAEMFAQSGWGGFVGVAAMLAVMASMGFGGGGSAGGTTGPGNQIDSSGRKATNQGVDNSMSGEGGSTNYNSSTGLYEKQNAKQLTDQEVIDRANAAAIDAAANALANLRIESMKLTKGSEELETSLARARLAAGGMGKAQYELATQGMSEAERASYNYNQALMAQISVQMDIANGTENTSENMRKLAGESRSLAIELMMASGDIAGARAMQREDDTAGYTKAEVAVYDHNQAVRDQIEAAQAGAAAAREAAQAEQELANTRYNLAGRLNILLGRQTQSEYDRVTELAGTTDTVSLEMLKLIYVMEDLTAAVDSQYAILERSIAKEKELANARLNTAQALSTALKTTVDSISPALSRKAAQAQVAFAVAISKLGGSLPSLAGIKPALDAIARPSADLFKTFEEYALDQAKTANDIVELSNAAEKQVSEAQKTIERLDLQLETAKAQLDALKGVDTSVKDVATAIKDFDTAMRALGNAKAGAGNYTTSPPVTGGSGGSGGYSGGGVSSGGSSVGTTYEDILGQDNKDIVAAYRAYYSRNPDETGYKAYIASQLTGDKLMQAILGASAADPNGVDFKTAVKNGYDPLDPLKKFLKSTLHPSAGTTGSSGVIEGSFAKGINEVPYDMVAQIHKGERILPAADNAALFNRLQSPVENNAALIAEIKSLRDEVSSLKLAANVTAANTGKTMRILDDLTAESGGDSLKVTVAA